MVMTKKTESKIRFGLFSIIYIEKTIDYIILISCFSLLCIFFCNFATKFSVLYETIVCIIVDMEQILT